MIPYTALGGTHDWLRGQWFYCDSPSAAFMRTEGFICQRPNHPLWSTAAGGVPGQKRRIWRFGGEVTLANYLRSIPVGDRRILSVSHGGQVAFYCAASGIELASLVTITMPQRADMEDIYRAGLKNIGTYTNVYSDSWWRDRWQILGTVWDGSFRFRRRFELEGVEVVNIGIPGVGHTELVRTEKMVLLKSSGVLARL